MPLVQHTSSDRGILSSTALGLAIIASSIALSACSVEPSIRSISLAGLRPAYEMIVPFGVGFPKEILDMAHFTEGRYCMPEKMLSEFFDDRGMPVCKKIDFSKVNRTGCFPSRAKANYPTEITENNDVIEIDMAVVGAEAGDITHYLQNLTVDDVQKAGKYANGFGYSLLLTKTITQAECDGIAVLSIRMHYMERGGGV